MAIIAQPHYTFLEGFGEIDAGLVTATNAVWETGQLTPIIKQELKYLIQSRRLSNGLDELEVNFTPLYKDEKKEVDPEKLLKRREQNKKAAKKFRQKSRAKHALCLEELEREEKRNTELKMEIQRLTTTKNVMIQMLIKVLKDKQRDR